MTALKHRCAVLSELEKKLGELLATAEAEQLDMVAYLILVARDEARIAMERELNPKHGQSSTAH